MLPLLIDENLRGLSRWLRFLGFDARQAAGEPDEELLRLAHREARRLFTRDRDLALHGGVFVSHTRTPAQLKEVLAGLGWPAEEEWFSRCVICNQRLRELPLAEGNRTWRCDSCARLYWRGSHYRRSLEFLRSLRQLE